MPTFKETDEIDVFVWDSASYYKLYNLRTDFKEEKLIKLNSISQTHAKDIWGELK